MEYDGSIIVMIVRIVMIVMIGMICIDKNNVVDNGKIERTVQHSFR